METAILRFFENIRTSFGTVLAGIFSLFGETLPVIALICVLYWLVNKRLGEKLVAVSFTSIGINAFLKGVIARPRPYAAGIVSRVEADTPVFSTMNLVPNESFPSGHSQMSAGLFFTIAFHVKKKWVWVVSVIVLLGVMCSRMYLGVHYPTDVLTGAALGIAFSCFWEYIYRKHENLKFHFIIGFAVLSLILLAISPNKQLTELSACLVASAIALPVENKFINFQNPQGAKNRLFRALIGFAIVGVIFGGFAILPWQYLWIKWIKYFLLVLGAALLAPWIFVKAKI